MTADVIDLAARRPEQSPGNGAREALIEMAAELPYCPERYICEAWADDVLMKLWMRGFKVVPLDLPA
jgi:hypothetical protein